MGGNYMSVGLALREARQVKKISQQALGSMGFCSGKLISAIEREERQPSFDIMGKLTYELDDPRLYMEVAEEVTGGVFSVPWLNGDCVDLHRSSVKEKVEEELNEAIESIRLTRICNNPKTCKSDQRRLIRKSILETIDVLVACTTYIAIMCREYEFSVRELFKEHRNKLVERGYLKNMKGCNL